MNEVGMPDVYYCLARYRELLVEAGFSDIHKERSCQHRNSVSYNPQLIDHDHHDHRRHGLSLFFIHRAVVTSKKDPARLS